MRIIQAYTDVPQAEKISLWYAGQPTKGLDRVADELIKALRADYDWYNKALIRLDVPETRLILLFQPEGQPRMIRILHFKSHDPHDYSKILAELRAMMAAEMEEGKDPNPS